MSGRIPGLVPLDGRGAGAHDIELGHVLGSFGVRGELRLFLHHRDSELLASPREVVLIGPQGERFGAKLSARSGAGLRVIGRVVGLDRCEDADRLVGFVLAIDRAALPAPGEDEVYVADLIGRDVVVDGVTVGRVVEVHNTPGGDLLEVSVGAGTEFVPLHASWIASLDGGVVTLTGRPWDDAP